jgi:branched-chain amino acid transport system permease protein
MESLQLTQGVVNALLLSGTLALVAIGFSIVWGILNIINLAHGAFLMVGAYTTYWLFTLYGIDPFLSLPISMGLMFVVGYLVQRYLINMVIRAPLLVTFLLTFALEIIIINLATNFWKGDLRSVTPAYAGMGFTLGNVQIPYVRLAAFAISLILTGLLHVFMAYTKTGNAIRATGMDIDAAQLQGVRIPHTYALTYGLGTALAAAAGSLISISFPFDPTVGGAYTLRAFVICVLGGLGSIPGVMMGAVVFAFIEVFSGIWAPSMKDAIALLVLVLVLIVRPSGIAGKAFYH